MERRIYILSALCILLSGCYGYVGGLDDSDFQFREVVFLNRSQHDIELRFPTSEWREAPDTIRLEKVNGIWKWNSEFDNSYSSEFFTEVEMLVDSKERFMFDDFSPSIPNNPCCNGMKNLNDSKGLYYVYDFNENTYESCKAYFDQLKIFKMTDVPPSYIDRDTLITDGSSEALFREFYPVASLRENISVGTVIGKKAESLDKISVHTEYGIAPGNVETTHKERIMGRQDKPCISYYDIDQLRKTGLAHFGCDFAELTGRDEMEKFCGCLYSTAHIKYAEKLKGTQETTDFLYSVDSEKAVISDIAYGNIKILLAEADCLGSRLYNHLYYTYMRDDRDNSSYYVSDISFYLIDLDENGDFRCRQGGPELVDLFLYPSDDEPSFPVYLDLLNYEEIHIQDIPL